MVVSSLKKKTATSNNNNNTNRQTAKVKKRVRIQVSSDQYDERNKKDDEYQEAREPATPTFTNDPFSSSEDPSWLDYFSSWNLDAVLPRHDEQQEHHQPNREEEQRQDQVDGTNNNDNDIHQRTRRIQDDTDTAREPLSSLPSCHGRRRRRRNSFTSHSTPTTTTTTTTSTTSNLRSDIRNPLKCLLCFSAKPQQPQDDNDNEPPPPQSRPRLVPISKSNNSKNQLSRLPWQGATATNNNKKNNNNNNNNNHTAKSTTSLFRRRPSLSDHSTPNNKNNQNQTRQASIPSGSTTTSSSSSSTSSSGVRYTDHATTTTTTTRQEDDTLSVSLDDTDDWSDASLTWMPLFANDEAASATSFSLTASPTYYREQYDLSLPLGYRRTLQRQRRRAMTDEDATTRVTTDFYSKHCLLVHGGMDDDEYDDYDEYNLSCILSDMMRLDSSSSSSTKRTTPATTRTNMAPRRNSLLATTTDQRDAPSKDPSTPWVTL